MKPSWLPIALLSLSLSAVLAAPTFAQALPEDSPPVEDLPEDELPTDEMPPGYEPPPGDASPNPTGASQRRRIRIELRSGGVVEGYLLSHSGGYDVQTAKGEVFVKEADVKKVVFPMQRINVDVDNLPLGKVMEGITRQTGHTIVVGAEEGKQRVSVSLRGIPWREAVFMIARMTGCQVERVGESLYLSAIAKVTLNFTNGDLRSILALASAYAGRGIVLAPELRGQLTCNLKEVEFKEALKAIAYACSFELSSKGRGVISARPLAQRPKAPEPDWKPFPQPRPKGAPAPKRINLDVMDVSLEDVAEQISEAVGENVLVDRDTKAVVSLSVRNAPWPEAVQLLARQAKCRARTGYSVVMLEQPPSNSLNAKNVPAAAWFLALAHLRGRNVVVAPEVNGLLEVDLADAFLDDAFEQSARAYGYQVAEFQDITVVTGKRYDPQAKPTGVRTSPFLAGAGTKAGPATAKLTSKQAKAFKKRVEEVISAIEAKAEAQDAEGMTQEFRRFRELLSEGEARGSLTSKDIAGFKQRLSRFGEIVLALELQIYIQRGNSLLKAMQKTIKDEDPRKALVYQAQLEQLAAEMRSQERDVFKRNADALVLRGRELADRALGKAGVIRTPSGPHRLHLESILWSDKGSVCVILGRIYREGDSYLLPSGEELSQVKVKAIAKDHVRLAVSGKEVRLKIR
jgi:hypothetical protein